MDNYKYLKVFYNDKLVGIFAKTPDRLVVFKHDADWLNNIKDKCLSLFD
ncbi:hypothetical protein IKQ21_08705 [bacterium]|nr:hypothetical protein [bacterium]